ncbi:MAG: DinB family protein [Candidatus Rokubacteria bacterium]|nr:DinB family protein [Candidatus Rokubacteria bacterium]
MDGLKFFLVQHARLHGAEVAPVEGGSFADRVFGGLSDDQLRLRPGRGLNSLAWLLWHVARTEDVAVNLVIAAGRQVFDDGWAGRLGVARRDIGTAMTDDEVSDLGARIDLAALRAYRTAVGRRTREVVGALPSAAWDEPVGPADTDRAVAAGAFGPRADWVPGLWQKRSRAGRLGSTAITHTAVHLGEALTVRSQAGLGLGL